MWASGSGRRGHRRSEADRFRKPPCDLIGETASGVPGYLIAEKTTERADLAIAFCARSDAVFFPSKFPWAKYCHGFGRVITGPELSSLSFVVSDRLNHIDRLYRQEQRRLLRVAQQRVGHAAAPDVVQDVFMAMWARAKDAIELTPAYLARATQFTAISLFRAEKRRAATLKTIVEEQYCAPVILPDQIVAARQDLRRLQEVIESLPSRTKQVFLLRRMHDCTYQEIALGLGISYSTVEREMGRALLACKALEAGAGDGSSA